ncbi:hypothetical protein MSAN_00445400 [Mycena sanguinolenta]|uniref:Uncharacterized protein n=1 Tax=Mycena sanguinolenta TaxID=230812 RepID=A0A8H6ZEU3_9AGAR|nr:hypothetical protein MSAN_00445400 [Mycena sanguinolenta]
MSGAARAQFAAPAYGYEEAREEAPREEGEGIHIASDFDHPEESRIRVESGASCAFSFPSPHRSPFFPYPPLFPFSSMALSSSSRLPASPLASPCPLADSETLFASPPPSAASTNFLLPTRSASLDQCKENAHKGYDSGISRQWNAALSTNSVSTNSPTTRTARSTRPELQE